MSTCPICLDYTLASDQWSCDTCSCEAHWSCVKKWWCEGAGCPVCRSCDFGRLFDALCVPKPITTAERIILFRYIVTAACVSSAFRISLNDNIANNLLDDGSPQEVRGYERVENRALSDAGYAGS